MFKETRHGERIVGRSVSPLPSMPNFSAPVTPERVWGPVVDMTDYQRTHALWMRQQQELMADIREELTSGVLPLCDTKTSDERRGRKSDHFRKKLQS